MSGVLIVIFLLTLPAFVSGRGEGVMKSRMKITRDAGGVGGDGFLFFLLLFFFVFSLAAGEQE